GGDCSPSWHCAPRRPRRARRSGCAVPARRVLRERYRPETGPRGKPFFAKTSETAPTERHRTRYVGGNLCARLPEALGIAGVDRDIDGLRGGGAVTCCLSPPEHPLATLQDGRH